MLNRVFGLIGPKISEIFWQTQATSRHQRLTVSSCGRLSARPGRGGLALARLRGGLLLCASASANPKGVWHLWHLVGVISANGTYGTYGTCYVFAGVHLSFKRVICPESSSAFFKR